MDGWLDTASVMLGQNNLMFEIRKFLGEVKVCRVHSSETSEQRGHKEAYWCNHLCREINELGQQQSASCVAL